MEKEQNIEEIIIKIKKLLNINNSKFRLMRNGINIIVGENNTGKTRLLNYSLTKTRIETNSTKNIRVVSKLYLYFLEVLGMVFPFMIQATNIL